MGRQAPIVAPQYFVHVRVKPRTVPKLEGKANVFRKELFEAFQCIWTAVRDFRNLPQRISPHTKIHRKRRRKLKKNRTELVVERCDGRVECLPWISHVPQL